MNEDLEQQRLLKDPFGEFTEDTWAEEFYKQFRYYAAYPFEEPSIHSAEFLRLT